MCESSLKTSLHGMGLASLVPHQGTFSDGAQDYIVVSYPDFPPARSGLVTIDRKRGCFLVSSV